RDLGRRVATLHTDVCWLRVSETCCVPAPTLFQCRALRRQDREHLRTATRHPSPKNHALSCLTFPPLFSLVSRFSKDLVLNGYPKRNASAEQRREWKSQGAR